MNINIFYNIVKNLDYKDLPKFALISSDSHYVIKHYIKNLLEAKKIIWKWWRKYQLPKDVPTYDSSYPTEFLINKSYHLSNISIPNLQDYSDVWIMIRYYNGKYYIQFNRNNVELKHWQGFIIGRTDYYGNFFYLTIKEYLLCLKRFGKCLHPYTNDIWTVKKGRRYKVGKIDEHYNIYDM